MVNSTNSEFIKYSKHFPLVSKFIATLTTCRSYLTTYNNNNRSKRYLKTDLNTLEDAIEEDDSKTHLVDNKLLFNITDVAIGCNYQPISKYLLGTSHCFEG